MKILIVDDDYNKTQEIVAVLTNTGIDGLNIKQETTAQAARNLLQTENFDMLIIDLHLPAVLGDTPDNNGGIELFDMICLDSKVNLPTDILFITGKEELLHEANVEVIKRGGVICQYCVDSDEWKKVLSGRVQYVNIRLANRSKQIDLAIVTALKTPELDAVLKLPYEWRTERIKGDPLTYHFGRFLGLDGNVSVVTASANRKGMPSSAAVATKLAIMFRPKYLAMLGICAGIQGKCNLGDVIVADPTWDWGSGKRGIDINGSPVFQAAPHQMQLNNGVSQLASDLADDQTVLGKIREGWVEASPSGVLKIHVGPMASGASVIADDSTARSIATQHRELMAIEMEAYAVMAAAEYAADPKPTAVIIKSVCDYANTEKNDDWQKYASYTSAAFADNLFRKLNINITR
ncbi:MAG: response regulator [Methylococcaceae bacterium]|nr:response regulator [Methylococcaceae bacterium]